MNKKQAKVQHSMQGVFVFMLLGAFAAMSTMMVLLGAQSYRSIVDHATQNNEGRTLGAYVRSMVRAQDADGSVELEQRDGMKLLALHETIDGEEYVTWLYCYEDMMYEQFTGAGRDFEPEGGSAICPAVSFEPKLENGLLTVDMVDGAGESCRVQVALRCAE